MYSDLFILLTDDPYPLRLVGGDTPNAGLIQILFNGEWGAVCNDEFDSADASVVCRQLGVPGPSIAVEQATRIFGPTDASSLLVRLGCQGNESRLIDCEFPGWRRSCLSAGYVGVFCQIGGSFFLPLMS